MLWPVDVLVEGPTDAVLASRLLGACALGVGTVYPRKGCGYVKRMLPKLSAGVTFSPLFVLLDFMDAGATCPPEAIQGLCPERQANLLLRLVVRELESWILADREGIAAYLGVALKYVPDDPERLDDPKRTLINVARRAKRASIREAMVPRPGYSASVGPEYVAYLTKFIRNHWDIDKACVRAPSLQRCVVRLRELHQRLEAG